MSLFFYGWWDIKYVPLLLFSIIFNYIIGKRLEVCRSKMTLFLGVGANILLLGYYKYTGFFLENIKYFTTSDVIIPEIILPLGISFFTFTQSAYLVDAYRGTTQNKSFITYCEFVTIFPHLIAGPIIDHKKMIPQFWADRTFIIDYKNIAIGLALVAMGLFKKVVIADNLSSKVQEVFSHTDSLTMADAWVGAIAYTLQLYFDFSAYSEMAIGLGLMLNLEFPINFDSPYQAKSIIDFWRRWHMTLGNWVKNYLYIPLGGNRCGELNKIRNLFVSMLIIGFWHGAGWTYVLWGGIHGTLLVINHLWRKLGFKLPAIFNWLLTFISVVCCWVVFRAENINDALNILLTMFNFGDISGSIKGVTLRSLVFLLIVVLFAPNPLKIINLFKPNKKWLLMIAILYIASIVCMSEESEFLYFQF